MPNIKPPFALHVLCWSHLDREWDFPFESTRIEFAAIIEDIMDLLEKNPACRSYHLDGQVVPLVDYLALKPEQLARVKRLTRKGRLLIGPWYTLPEMNVIAGECLARNFLRAQKAAAPLGGVMKVGLSNTSWGQISQMPQILRNFGIDSYTSYRGVPVNDIERECLWEGSDGSRVMLIRPSPGPRSIFYIKVMVPAHRYHRWREAPHGEIPAPLPGVRLSRNDSAILDPYFTEFDPKIELEHVVRRVPEILRILEPDATTRQLWIGYWQDGMHPHPKLMRVVDEARRHLPPGYTIAVSGLPEYVAAIQHERRGLKVQVHGEMRTPRKGGDAAEMMNVLSTRPALKIANRDAEIALIYGADYWAAVAGAMGMKHPQVALDRAWHLLLVNQCHDTIGGVGVDRVHDDQLNRYARLMDLTETVMRQSVSHLVRHTGFMPQQPGESGLTVFNPLPYERTTIMECSLDVPSPAVQGGIRVVAANGRALKVEELSSRRLDTKVYSPYDRYSMQDVCRYRVRLRLEKLPACGWANYTVQPAQMAPMERPMPGGVNWMANDFLRVTFRPDGTYTLRARGITHAFNPCGWYEDTGNVWNGWGNQRPAHDVRVVSTGAAARIRRVTHTALQTTFIVQSVLRVPISANDARDARVSKTTAIPIRTEITLRTGSPVLHIRTTLTNTARDHRLRVMFPSIPGATHTWAETPYDVVKRAIKVPDSTDWAEPWQGTHPMLNFVDVSDGHTGLALIPHGLCEYEVLDDADRTLALTLLRAYAHRHPIHKNIMAPEVKGSQCPGEQTFEYSLYPHQGDWERGNVPGVAYDTLVPVTPVQHFGHSLPGPRRASFIQIASGKLILHALKKAEHGQALVVRIGNPTNRTIKTDVRCLLGLQKAALCDMAEQPLKKLAVHDHNAVKIILGPKKIISLLITPDRI